MQGEHLMLLNPQGYPIAFCQIQAHSEWMAPSPKPDPDCEASQKHAPRTNQTIQSEVVADSFIMMAAHDLLKCQGNHFLSEEFPTFALQFCWVFPDVHTSLAISGQCVYL